ncbi:MAG: HAMP domain-containing histidine kinase [Acidimicrobiia bacterium]|nr:HAMP domain-containing histidine kinase [Acidimicrobiia bacterium]MDH5420750.1 HAMP domain-containing histidine kinase [Acidimicrobiia bacterium]MDH5502846.1 HAMP domain-containing histidine kinase [Acidimicrobiia bacterium]
MSLRLRSTLGGMAAVFVAIFVFGAAIGWLVRVSAPNDLTKRVTAQATALAALAATSPPETVTFPEADFYLLDEDRQVISATTRVTAESELVRLADNPYVDGSSTGLIKTEAVEYRAAAVPWTNETIDRSGVAIVYERTDGVDEQLAGLRAVVWIAAIFATVAAGAAAWFASGRALRPLGAIARAADEIADTTTDRLPPPIRDDEIGSLTSSLNRMLDRLAAARQELRESVTRQEQFVADASHELRSPMTTIRTNAEFLMSRPDAAPEDITNAAVDIVAESERISILVDDLLTLARADEQQALRSEPVDLTGMLARLAHDLTSARRPIQLAVTDQVTVSGDGAALERLVRILIDNALRHGAGTITLGLNQTSDAATLTVLDEGPGFRSDQLDRVFDRFFRSNPARSPHGTGLGLAIAKSTVERHQGTIRAENANAGGRIVVSLPIDGLINL